MKVRCQFDSNQKPSKETLDRLSKAAEFPVIPDEECPELTDEQIERIREQRKNQLYLSKKKVVSIRLSNKTIETAKKLGKGYTSIIADIIETTFADEKLLNQFIR